MVGISIVGFSGSMVKDAVKDASIPLLSALVVGSTNGTSPSAPPEPIESPEVTSVLLGAWLRFISISCH